MMKAEDWKNLIAYAKQQLVIIKNNEKYEFLGENIEFSLNEENFSDLISIVRVFGKDLLSIYDGKNRVISKYAFDKSVAMKTFRMQKYFDILDRVGLGLYVDGSRVESARDLMGAIEKKIYFMGIDNPKSMMQFNIKPNELNSIKSLRPIMMKTAVSLLVKLNSKLEIREV